MNFNLIPQWRQRRILRKTLMNRHNLVRPTPTIERGDTETDNEERSFDEDLLNYLPNPEAFLKKKSTNLIDSLTEEDTDEERLTCFLADYLRLKGEGSVSDQNSSKILNLISSFLSKDIKCPRTLEGCRSYVRNREPEVASIYGEAEEVEYDGGRLLLMPFNKIVKNVVKRNIDYLLPQVNEEGIVDINLQLHTDGVEVAKSSKIKMWPLTAIIENLPGKVRVAKSNVIVIAIHVSTVVPDFRIFCQRFVQEFKSGIQAIFYDDDDRTFSRRMVKIRVRCKMLTGDIPAIRSILNLQGHSCQFGCIHCYCESVTEASVFGQGRKRTYASSEAYALRTNDSYQKDLNQLTNAGVAFFFGVKGVSHLANLIRVPEDVSIDYFHSVLLGPFKEDMNRIVRGYQSLNKDKTVVFIKGFVESQTSHFKKAIELSLFPSEFNRKLKPLTEIDNYKGIEWKNMLLYAMPTILGDICNGSCKPLYLVNLCLANAVIVLMKDNVSAIEIKKSQEQLYQWYKDRTDILGNDAMTLKAHQVTHLAEIVQRHGSLCNYSCFFGEGLAYNLTKMISLKTLDKSLNQLKTRLTDFHVINAIGDHKKKKQLEVIDCIETRMCVRDFCHSHFDNSLLEVQELSECSFKSYIFKPAYDIPFAKDSFLAYTCEQSKFKCAIGVVKSIVSIDTKVWFIIKPMKIKSTILDKIPVNSNETVMNRIKENTMFDYYYCLEDYMSKEEMTAYRPLSYFARESSQLAMIDKSAILYKCLVINTPGRKSYCCPIIAPFEHN
uniref:DUF659 domain-containing protein n=1 Tax=Strongyloides papillosus TaxID=174720 RepID=A0A0N5BLP5_STREA